MHHKLFLLSLQPSLLTQKGTGHLLFIDFKKEYKSPKNGVMKKGGRRTIPEMYSRTQKNCKNEFVIYCSSKPAVTNTLEIYPFYASILLTLLLCCS